MHDDIDLKDQRVGRAFGTAVANMEIGSDRDPWGNAYQEGLDMVYREIGQRIPDRRSIE